MRTPVLALLVLATFPFNAQSEIDPEKECAQAVMGFLKSKNVIGSGEEGLCLSDLESMPAVNIGLGSKTFPKGQSDSFTPSSTTKNNIQSLKEIFASSPGSSFAFAGYADGLEYKSNDFDKKFLGDKTTFTKTDVMNKLSSDPGTMKAVVEKLKNYSDTEEISFEKDPAVTSLIRNHYLAEARARAVCQVTMGEGCNEKSLNGFASPNLEAANHRECGPRRRAVIQINGSSFNGKRPAKDGVLRPNFSIPEDAEERRDMQLAAGLNLFQRLKETSGGTDPAKYEAAIEAAIPTPCQKDTGVRQNAKDNFRMMLDHTKKLAEKSNNSALKSAIFSGDYVKVKKQLNALVTIKEKRDLNPTEQADMDLIDTAMSGYSTTIEDEFEFGAVKGTDKNFAGGKGFYVFKLKDAEGKIREVKAYRVWGTNDNEVHFSIGASTYKADRSKVSIYPMAFDSFMKDIAKNTDKSVANSYYKNYPNASLHSPSTDMFNCLSSAAAIEDHMSDESHKPMLIEASTLVSQGSNDVSIELPLGSIPKVEKYGRTYRGWVCTGCNSGIQVQDPYPDGRSVAQAKADHYAGYVKDFASLGYQTRDISIHSTDSRNSMIAQKSNKELTVGSMKTLSVYNISRAAFGDKCPDSKSVCDCLKNIEPGKGELDRILASEGSQKVAMNSVANNKSQKTGTGFKAQTTVGDAKNHCMFIPPVPHSCKVDPQGQSKDRTARTKENALSCQLFAKLKTKYPDFDAAKASTYAKIPLGGAVCKKSLPTTDEGKDCGITINSNSANGTQGSAQ